MRLPRRPHRVRHVVAWLATPKRTRSLVREIADANAFANVRRSFTRSLTAPPKKSAATDAIHFFSVPFANKVGPARGRPPSIHPMSQMDNSSSLPSLPLPSPLLSLGMFSCAHVRANYFSISRVFDCSRQSSTSSSVDRPSKHDTFPLPHRPTDRPTRPEAGRLAPVAAATIIFVLIWEEKSRGRKRRIEESSVRRRPTHMRPTVGRSNMVPRVRFFVGGDRDSGERRLDNSSSDRCGGVRARQLGAIQMRTRGKRGAKEKWPTHLFRGYDVGRIWPAKHHLRPDSTYFLATR